VPDSLKIVIYKLLTEALNNIAKHAHASLVQLSLKKRGANVELFIEDNGRGFDFEEMSYQIFEAEGFGLASMKERAEIFGGSFEICTRKGKGTKIRVLWPSK
jgi:signal transduction histidine kinase